MTLPYANATSGKNAMDDIRKVIMAFGCSKFAPMEDFHAGTVAIQFEYRGRMVQVEASAKGYAATLMKQPKRRDTKGPSSRWSEADALAQGQIAVWSILRDWIKGQLTAIDTGILTFDSAFLGQILLPDGRTVHKHIEERDMLPALEAPK